MPALRIKLPNSDETTHVFREDRITVGRSPDNTIQIPHASISNHHAEFVAVNGRYQLHDLHSTNRSYVEGQPVTEFNLKDSCKILFGSVECQFDPAPASALPPAPKRPNLLRPQPPKSSPDAAFLECENRALRERLHSLQRRFDILGSARLTTGKSDLTPLAATSDAVKSLSAERDDLRQEGEGLRLVVEKLREELAITARERDAARHAAEALQAERAALHAELKQTQIRVTQLQTAAKARQAPALPPPKKPPVVTAILTPPRPPGVGPKPATPKAATIPEPNEDLLPENVHAFREVLARLSATPADESLLGLTGARLTEIVSNATPLGDHAFRRIAHSTHEFVRELGRSAQTPAETMLRTLRNAGEFLSRLLESRRFAAARNLRAARVLAIDDDADLLQTLITGLKSPDLDITGCASAEDAIAAIQKREYDAILADLRLPGMDGAAFCARARELPEYRRTPILFLTVADTLDKRAETSLSGGNEFIAKPFSICELTLKVKCWALKHQLQLP